MDNWDDLKTVLAVGRAGSLSRAARRLGVTHSTVSRRLAVFEERLGSRLFDRLPEGFVPTAAGVDALEAASRIEAELLALDTRITAQDAELEGVLRITAPQLLFQVQVADVLKDFADRHPQIELEMIAANEILSLQRREADVAIRVTDVPGEGLFGRLAARQRRTFYASRDFVRQHADALAHSAADVPLGCIVFKWADRAVPDQIAARYPNAFVSVVADDMIAAQAAARAGLGLCQMPCFMGDTDPALERVPGVEPSRYYDIWLLTLPDLKNVAKIRAFMRFAAEAFKEKSSLYLGE